MTSSNSCLAVNKIRSVKLAHHHSKPMFSIEFETEYGTIFPVYIDEASAFLLADRIKIELEAYFESQTKTP